MHEERITAMPAETCGLSSGGVESGPTGPETCAPAARGPRVQQQAEARKADPVTATVPAVCAAFGISRSELYRRLAAGDVQAVKMGKRTLVLVASVRAYIASLPQATFRAPREAA